MIWGLITESCYTSPCRSQRALHLEMQMSDVNEDVSVFVQLQSSASGSRLVVRMNAALLHFLTWTIASFQLVIFT